MAPAIFGIMPKADCNCCSADFERSGADPELRIGKSVMCGHSLLTCFAIYYECKWPYAAE